MLNVWVGWDAAEMQAAHVSMATILRHASAPVNLRRIERGMLRGDYTRPTSIRGGRLYDEISEAPMSTDHAIARFFVPLLQARGWALFVDGDVLCRADLAALFALADPRFAVQVVQHGPLLEEGMKKRDDAQLAYPRKNWSSVVLWNCDHPAHDALTLEVLNTWPGRDLHAFRWLPDAAIGALPAGWNYLVGVEPRPEEVYLAHFTLGTPDTPGHEGDEFAAEWFAAAARERATA